MRKAVRLQDLHLSANGTAEILMSDGELGNISFDADSDGSIDTIF